jgi:hypothetical protein
MTSEGEARRARLGEAACEAAQRCADEAPTFSPRILASLDAVISSVRRKPRDQSDGQTDTAA